MSGLLHLDDDESLYISQQGLKQIYQNYNQSDPDKNTLWTTDYRIELPIRIKKDGLGSIPPFSLIEAFQNTLRQFPYKSALRVKRNNKWISWSFEKYFEDCCNFAKGLISKNITHGHSVNIIGFNSPEWLISFYGSIFGSYLPVGIYTTNQTDSCKYVSSHSDAEVIVVENREHLDKYLKVWDELPLLKLILIYADKIPDNLPENRKGQVMLFNDLLEIGRNYHAQDQENELSNIMKKQKPGNCCTLVYTSGTTGAPKAVMLSHDNYTWVCTALSKMQFHFSPGQERLVSFLPLSHVAAQILDIVSPMIFGFEIVFADPSALQGSLVETLKEVRPTIFFAVPRVWEKIEEKMKQVGLSNGTIKQYIGLKAKQMGKSGTFNEIFGYETPLFWNFMKKIVYNNVKKSLGLDQARYLCFGAAPLNLQTKEYFLSLNMFLINIYGMSESTGPQTCTDPKNFEKFDQYALQSAGIKVLGTDLKIENPDKDGNGEICYKGRNRFMGYYKDEQSTRNTIDSLGYLHSGDIGKLDIRGNLLITGRLKELIITAGGENIAPILIEDSIKEELKFINNAMVIGDHRKYLVVLLTFKQELSPEGDPLNQLTEEAIRELNILGINVKTLTEAIDNQLVNKEINEGIKRANNKSISRAHHIRKWLILQKDFNVNDGDLTPTLKLKRAVVYKKNLNLIENLYQDPKL